MYCQLNTMVPIIRQYLDETVDLRPNPSLSRLSIAALTAALHFDVAHGWAKDIEVLVFIYWLAHATSYRVISTAFDIPRSTIHDIVHRISRAVIGILGQTIRFPRGDQLEEVGAGFSHLAGCPPFSVVVGAVDGCHVRIKPPAANAQCYFNRKLFPSIQLQAICDHRGRFLDIFVGFPGSVHDARVLKNSPVYVRQLYPPEGKCILGDGGYPCLAAPMRLVTPYREPVQNSAQARFNRKHSRARCIIERAFGMMMTRWRSIFYKALEVCPTFAAEVVACCAILHNICLDNGDIVEEVIMEPADDDHSILGCADVTSGDTLRDTLSAAVSAPEVAVPALQEHDY